MPTLRYAIGVDADSCSFAHTGTIFDATGVSAYVGQVGTANFDLTFRFPNIYIAQGATINHAYLRWIAATSQSNTTVNLTVYGNDVDNAVAPTVYLDGILTGSGGNFVDTTATVAWSPAAYTAATEYISPDLQAVIQEIINRGGWASGNALQVLIREAGSSINAYRDITMGTVALDIDYNGDIISYMGDSISIVSTVGRAVYFSRATTDTLTPAQTLAKQIEFHRGFSDALTFDAFIPDPLGTTRTVTSVMSLTSTPSSDLKGGIFVDTLGITDSIASGPSTFNRTVIDYISLLSSANRTIEEDVLSGITFAQSYEGTPNGIIEHVVGVDHSFAYTLSHPIISTITISHTISYTITRSRAIQSDVAVRSFPTFFAISDTTLTDYTPFITSTGISSDLAWFTLTYGELEDLSESEYDTLISEIGTGGLGDGYLPGSGGDGGDGTGGFAPGGNAETSPINHPGGSAGYELPPSPLAPIITESDTITLTYPYDSPTSTLAIRNPELGNTHEFSPTKIQRQSAGGSLIQFRDGIWSKYRKLSMTFFGLTKLEAENLLSFFYDSAGQEIGLLDYESQQWKGIILTPDSEVITRHDDCNYRASFEFEGEIVA